MSTTAHRLERAVLARVRGGRARLIGTLVRVRTQAAAVALTFDDGPDPEYTPQLLEILARHHARATFFMIGARAAAYPEVVQAVAAAGHTIANHGWDHPRFPDIHPGERRSQMERCAAALRPFGQPFFRPPYTLQSFGSFLSARRLGYQVVAWNVEVGDWREGDADRLVRRLLQRVRPGSIVVLHDALWRPGPGAEPDRAPTIAAVDAMLERLSPTHSFLTLPELMRSGRPVWRPWFVRHDQDWDRLRR